MPSLDTLLGLAGQVYGQVFAVQAVNANLTLPDRVGLVALHVQSNAVAPTITLPALTSVRGGCLIIATCPDAAGNNVTFAPRAGNTIAGGASLVVSADNIAVLIGIPGTTDWRANVVA